MQGIQLLRRVYILLRYSATTPQSRVPDVDEWKRPAARPLILCSLTCRRKANASPAPETGRHKWSSSPFMKTGTSQIQAGTYPTLIQSGVSPA